MPKQPLFTDREYHLARAADITCRSICKQLKLLTEVCSASPDLFPLLDMVNKAQPPARAAERFARKLFDRERLRTGQVQQLPLEGEEATP